MEKVKILEPFDFLRNETPEEIEEEENERWADRFIYEGGQNGEPEGRKIPAQNSRDAKKWQNFKSFKTIRKPRKRNAMGWRFTRHLP